MKSPKQEYIKYRISKSQETFADAELLAENERWNSCVNRLYYSSYFLVSALLLKHGIKAETHNGVKTQFFLHFIKSAKLDRDYAKLYTHLFDWRQESDYADFIEFDRETVEPLLEKVFEFNAIILKLLS